MTNSTRENVKAPGLKWRTRKDGTRIPIWCARQDAVSAGFQIKTFNLSNEAGAEISARCHRLWAEMIDFVKHGPGVWTYDGTLSSLLNSYHANPDSSFARLKPSSRAPYLHYLEKLQTAYGGREVVSITGLDILRWHRQWRAATVEGGAERLGAATMALSVLKAALAWGAICGFDNCRKLREVARLLSLPRPRSRQEVPTAQDVERARQAAHDLGRHRAALAYALQFETAARQWDIVGQWVPMSDPRPSTVLAGARKWIGPTWMAIDAELVLTITPSKTLRTTGRRVTIDLKLLPMVVEELALIPTKERVGPLIVNERTGLPYWQHGFGDVWQEVRRKAGLPATLWNRDLRAGAITEGGMAGATSDDRAKMAGHASPKMTKAVYDRDVLVGSNRVAEARAAFRKKESAAKSGVRLVDIDIPSD